MLFGVGLDRGADVAQPRPGAHLHDPEPHALERDVHQAARLDARLADEEHAAAVAMESVLDDGDVDVEDITRFQHPVARYAVADLVIHRGADRLRKLLVARRSVMPRS